MRTFHNLGLGLLLFTSCASAAETAPATVRTPATVDFSSCEKPTWPRASLAKEETGVVHLSFLISEAGRIMEAGVVQSSGAPLLDQAALEGISRCRFTPTKVDGKAVEGGVKLQYVWTLENPSQEEAAALELLRKKDENGAAKLMRVAAEKGRAQAQFKFASFLYHGVGVSKDPVAALQWLKKSADQFYAPAMGAYGSALLRQGDADQEAFRWLQDGARYHDVQAMYVLGACYEEGRGTAVDLDQARHWYQRAADSGHVQAKSALKAL